MFNRRTLLSLAAVAAVAGGAAGSITSAITNPGTASAETAPPPPTRVLGKVAPSTLPSIGKMLARVDSQTNQIAALTAAVARIEAKVDATNDSVGHVREVTSATANWLRTPSGRSPGNLLETIEQQTR